ncbi:MAG: diguanylate cyclase [Actinomycetota bacterium]
MSLQSRLFLFFTVAVVVPLAIAGVLSESAVSSTLTNRDQTRVQTATPGLTALLTAEINDIQPVVAAIAEGNGFTTALATAISTGDATQLSSVLQLDLSASSQNPIQLSSTLDFAVVENADGGIIASVTGAPNYIPGNTPPTKEQLLNPAAGVPTGTNMPVSKVFVPLLGGPQGGRIGTLVGGIYLDNNFAQSMRTSAAVDVTIVVGGKAVASSIGGAASPWSFPVSKSRLSPFSTTIGGHSADAEVTKLVSSVPVRDAALVTSVPPTSQRKGRVYLAAILVVLALAAAAAALLGFLLSGAIARPLRQLAGAADAIAAGNYDSRIDVRSGHEVGRLARAFNAMAQSLAVHITELSESREELRRSLTRFGETLRSTHDLDKILQVVLDTSVDALRATGGVLLVVNPEGAFAGQLTVAAARGVATDSLVLREGEGIAGAVALNGDPIRLPDSDLAGPPPPLLDPEEGAEQRATPAGATGATPAGATGATPETAFGDPGSSAAVPPGSVPSAAVPSAAVPSAALSSGALASGAKPSGRTNGREAARRAGATAGHSLTAEPSPAEPPFRTGIWVPVFAQGRIFAVLALFDREDGGMFTARDLDTVMSLSDQAGVAIDNVVLHEEAQRLAITDGMTGIWNHRYFQLRFDQEMDRSARFRRPFCLLLCDIDDFKVVNDSYGHLVGDSVLIELARRIRSEVRDIDVLARYGGEEFVLILPETDADGGQRAADKIRRRIGDSPFGRDRQIPVTISVGVACFPRAGTDQTALLRAADVALYQAKAGGKDRIVFYVPTEEGKPSHVG